MSRQPRSPATENTEEARAFLQQRVALFWKVAFWIGVISLALSFTGVVVAPGLDVAINVLSTAQAGLFWYLCGRGTRSIIFSQWMEGGGLFLNMVVGGILGRYLLAGVLSGDSVPFGPAFDGASNLEVAMMSDAYVSMLLIGGTSIMVTIRAALIPSQARRTILVTTLAGVPIITLSSILVPTDGGGLALRAAGSGIYPWLPTTSVVMWGFVVLACAVISWVIYGLRAEVHEARRLGQYVLEQKLGEGGMGEVYRARHGMMRRPTAIKLLRPETSGIANAQRFEQEVQLTSRLTHPNTITIFDYGRTHDDVFYYAMELLEGATLRRIVEVGGAQPAGRVVRVLEMACGALAEAHALGLIHRDIKPANIMLCTRGGELDVVKVLDFGLVKELDVESDVKVTADNTITGTPQYLAPESIRAPESVDARTDLYALGAVAYYLLSGAEVFEGKSVVEVCGQHLHETPQPLSERGVEVPASLEALVLSCLEKDPSKRPQSAAELRRRVEACEVEAWDSADAAAWWSRHRSKLDDREDRTEMRAMTLGVDRSRSTGDRAD